MIDTLIMTFGPATVILGAGVLLLAFWLTVTGRMLGQKRSGNNTPD